MSYQPRLSVETLRQLAKDRMVRKIATNWTPDKRHASNAAAQTEYLDELTADIVEYLPSKENAECVGLILDNAWKALRQSRKYSTWPMTKEVLDVIQASVNDFTRKTTAPAEKPALAVPATSRMSRAEHEAWMAKALERNKDIPRSASEMRMYRRRMGKPHPHEARWFPNGLPGLGDDDMPAPMKRIA